VAEALIFGNPAGCRPTRPQVKNGTPGTHPLTGRELRELRQHQRENLKSPFMFVSERGATGFSRKDRVDTLQAYLGHRNIKNTTCYTAWRRIGSRDSGRISEVKAIIIGSRYLRGIASCAFRGLCGPWRCFLDSL
jgi:hypothetical protein